MGRHTELTREFDASVARGVFVVLGGPDGVGKTTLAAALFEAWAGPTRYFHFIPHPTRPLSSHTPDPREPSQPKNRVRSSRVGGVLRLARNWVRGWIAYLGPIRRAVRSGTLVVGDRWLHGYVAQPRALRFEGPAWLARLAIKTSPRPSLFVLLDAPAAVIHRRKQELALEEIESERIMWLNVPRRPYVVDSLRPPSELAAEIIRTVSLRTNFVKYPPRAGRVLVPRQPRQMTVAGTGLYAPCRPTVVAAHWAMRGLIGAVSGYWLAPVDLWERGVPTELWLELLAAISRDGLEAEAVAVHTRSPRMRKGFGLVTLNGGEVTAVVRVGSRQDIQNESATLDLVRQGAPATFRYPVVIGTGSVGDMAYLTTTSVLGGFHRPARRPPLAEIVSEVQSVLARMPQKPEVRPSWVPIHGDLTPWNLRESRLGLGLIDWEDATWGPPGADELLYAESAVVAGRRVPVPPLNREAAEFWIRNPATEARVRAHLQKRLTDVGAEREL
jgi:thymidylate kinase